MRIPCLLLMAALISGCHKKENGPSQLPTTSAVVTESGAKIKLPKDEKTLSFFETKKVKSENVSAHYTAPASVAVSILPGPAARTSNIVLFDNPDLNAAYTQFLQHLINIRTYNVNLARVKDLAEHGAATGKEVLDAETQLANEEAGITQQEAQLKLAGMEPQKLRDPIAKQVWLISEVPESQIAELQTGVRCTIRFTAYGDQEFTGTIDGMGSEVDNITRMVKVRVLVPNPANRFQVGMFATVSFVLQEGNAMSVPISSLVNVQGKDFAFVRLSETEFERRQLLLGQQLDDSMVVLRGLDENDQVVVKGAMQLKGISFGY
jgi:membrane fusion protein, heavy metal efflux system